MRRNLLAFALFTLALLAGAQAISALTTTPNATNKTEDSPDSGASSVGEPDGICPRCGCLMKFCEPPSEYKWICHNCRYYVLR